MLDAYYETIDLSKLVAAGTDDELKRLNQKRIRKALAESAHIKEFTKLAYQHGEQPRIRDEPPLIFHNADMQQQAAMHADAERMVADYMASLAPERRILMQRYSFADVAMKVVGVGSVGTYCGVALFVSGNGDPLFLQFKEARPSVLEPYCGRAPFKHHGERVVFGQRLMQAAADAFLGWTTGTRQPQRHYYVRQLRDAKIKPMVELMSPREPDRLCKVLRMGAGAGPQSVRAMRSCCRPTWAAARSSRTRWPLLRFATPIRMNATMRPWWPSPCVRAGSKRASASSGLRGAWGWLHDGHLRSTAVRRRIGLRGRCSLRRQPSRDLVKHLRAPMLQRAAAAASAAGLLGMAAAAFAKPALQPQLPPEIERARAEPAVVRVAEGMRSTTPATCRRPVLRLLMPAVAGVGRWVRGRALVVEVDVICSSSCADDVFPAGRARA